jgi:methanogenic corrinoid protein MtbC1
MDQELVTPSRCDAPIWPGGQHPIATLTYRSWATEPVAACGLERLLTRAKARNRRLGVTGMLLYSDRQFFQWLEGPPEALAEVWDAIRGDPRHGQIELIDHHPRSMRLFGDWDMRFVCRDADLAALQDPADAPRALPPALISLLAETALRGDEHGIGEGLEELLWMGHDFLGLHSALIEPAARLLGDWWADDLVGGADIAMGLSYLQSAVRRVGAARGPIGVGGGAAGHILIATAPGETHMLGAALAADVFREAGWRVTSEFPGSSEALVGALRSERYDALSLCLSDVFDRADRIEALAKTISAARAATPGDHPIILAGGRLFRTRPGLAEVIGADAVFVGAADAVAKTLTQIAGAEGTLRTRDRPLEMLH